MSNTEHLVKMANQIESFFRSEIDRKVAVENISGHIKRFWDPRMRKEIINYVHSGGQGLGELSLEAIKYLASSAKGY
jgi:formate dehydrogenase subunit delta